MKVFALIETYTEDSDRRPKENDKRFISVHTKRKGAVDALAKRHDEIIDEIIGGDDNNLSRISVDDRFVGKDFETPTYCDIVNDCCQEWELSIEEVELCGLDGEGVLHRFKKDDIIYIPEDGEFCSILSASCVDGYEICTTDGHRKRVPTKYVDKRSQKIGEVTKDAESWWNE